MITWSKKTYSNNNRRDIILMAEDRIVPDRKAHVHEEPICAVCQRSIEIHDYVGEVLNLTHEINLTIIATAGDAFLPHVLEVHGDCLKELRDQIIKINEGEPWV
jgi:hypothetical protein